MMPIPALPTDSLYKFMSVGGLVCSLASVTLLFVTAQYVVNERATLISVFHERSDQLLQLTIQIHDIDFEIAQQSGNWNDSAKAARTGKLAVIKERSDAIDKEIMDRRRGLEKNGETLITNLGVCGNVAVGFGLFGGAIAITGFILWGLRVQVFQDAILQYQYEKLKHELACLSAASSVPPPSVKG